MLAKSASVRFCPSAAVLGWRVAGNFQQSSTKTNVKILPVESLAIAVELRRIVKLLATGTGTAEPQAKRIHVLTVEGVPGIVPKMECEQK